MERWPHRRSPQGGQRTQQAAQKNLDAAREVNLKLIVFSHANSFPAGTYGVMFRELRERGYTVRAIEKLGHDSRYPVSSNWPHLVQQLSEFVQTEVAQQGSPAYLVGHSLGGYLSLMTACLRPELARGVVLLDSPLVGGWKARVLALAKHTGVVGSFAPGAVSQRRRNRWPGLPETLAHFQGKKAFAAFHPQVLHDYVHVCTDDDQGQRTLSFDRAIETAIYNNFPHHLGRLLRQHPLQCPVAFIGGEQSQEVRQVGLQMTRRIVGSRLTQLPGTHLFPMESPLATAAAVDAMITQLS